MISIRHETIREKYKKNELEYFNCTTQKLTFVSDTYIIIISNKNLL